MGFKEEQLEGRRRSSTAASPGAENTFPAGVLRIRYKTLMEDVVVTERKLIFRSVISIEW